MDEGVAASVSIDADSESVGYLVFIGLPTPWKRSFIPELRYCLCLVIALRQRPRSFIMSTAVCTTESLASLPSSTRTASAVPPAVRRGAWQIAPGEAMSLKARSASVLRVKQGRVWVTPDATSASASEDLVLAPGESLNVAAGQRIVMEAWDGYGATYSWDQA
jgi:hypothetical protein